MIIILQWFNPLNSRLEVNMETFNEYTTLVIIILLMCMTDFVLDVNTRHSLGKVYIAVICVFGLVHIIPMLWRSARRLQLSMKRRYNRSAKMQSYYGRLKSYFRCCAKIQSCYGRLKSFFSCCSCCKRWCNGTTTSTTTAKSALDLSEQPKE